MFHPISQTICQSFQRVSRFDVREECFDSRYIAGGNAPIVLLDFVRATPEQSWKLARLETFREKLVLDKRDKYYFRRWKWDGFEPRRFLVYQVTEQCVGQVPGFITLASVIVGHWSRQRRSQWSWLALVIAPDFPRLPTTAVRLLLGPESFCDLFVRTGPRVLLKRSAKFDVPRQRWAPWQRVRKSNGNAFETYSWTFARRLRESSSGSLNIREIARIWDAPQASLSYLSGMKLYSWPKYIQRINRCKLNDSNWKSIILQ